MVLVIIWITLDSDSPEVVLAGMKHCKQETCKARSSPISWSHKQYSLQREDIMLRSLLRRYELEPDNYEVKIRLLLTLANR